MYYSGAAAIESSNPVSDGDSPAVKVPDAHEGKGPGTVSPVVRDPNSHTLPPSHIPAHSVSVGEIHGPLRPLVEEEPVLLHILAYQRTASTVIGNMMGDLPGQFFMYEPLDLTFTALYGSDPGWNIPSDIFNSPDGKIRPADPDELTAMRWTMDSIFQCKMADNWPVQFLVHPFWFYYGNSAMTSYKSCLGQSKPSHSLQVTKKSLANCMNHLQSLCKGHYSSGSAKLKKCKNIMWKDGAYRTSLTPQEVSEGTKYGFSEAEMKKFDSYFRCLHTYEDMARSCARRYLDQPCSESNIRVIKTVRASMEVPEAFFMDYPNFRLIHLFRDPRGAAKSRLDQGWSQGSFETRNVTKIARTYCQNVYSDYKLREDLNAKYPGQTAQILSDDFMLHSLDYVEHMAELIGKNVTHMKNLITTRMKRQGIEARESEHTQQLVEDAEQDGNDDKPGDASSRKLLQVWSDQGPVYLEEDGQLSAEPSHYVGRHLQALFTHRSSLARLPANRTVARKPVSRSGVPPGKKVLKGENRLNKWQGVLLWKDVKAIESVCQEFYNGIPYKWQF